MSTTTHANSAEFTLALKRYTPHIVQLDPKKHDGKGGVKNWNTRPYTGAPLTRYGVIPSTIGLLVVDVDRKHVNTDAQVLTACEHIAKAIGPPAATAPSTSGVGRHMLYRVAAIPSASTKGRIPKTNYPGTGNCCTTPHLSLSTNPLHGWPRPLPPTAYDAQDLCNRLLRALPRPTVSPSKGKFPATPADMAQWPEGDRTTGLNTAVYVLKSNGVWSDDLRDEWVNAALAAGLTSTEANNTIDGALNAAVEKPRYIPSIIQLPHYLRAFGVDRRYNVRVGHLEFRFPGQDWSPFKDTTVPSVMGLIETHMVSTTGKTARAKAGDIRIGLLNVMSADHVDPLLETLRALPQWDTVPRIDTTFWTLFDNPYPPFTLLTPTPYAVL